MALRVSDEQAHVLGIEAHIPLRAKRATGKDANGMNKLEARFARWLDDQKHYDLLDAYYFEEIKFRLAARTFYTPDFYVVWTTGLSCVYEIKGFWRDDARVKIKVAAEKYPHIRWVAVRWIGKGWDHEVIKGRKTSHGQV